MTKLLLPPDNGTVGLMNTEQKEFLSRRSPAGEAGSFDWRNPERTENEDHTAPERVPFQWETDDKLSVWELSVYEDFRSGKRLCVAGSDLSAGNLMANTVYFWRVSGSEPFSFRTEDTAPRWIWVDGLTNVRDMGAWKTTDGRRVRQGLLLRGSEMDTHLTITAEGIRTMREDLHIRTDLDLREEAVGQVTESPLGGDITFLNIPACAYDTFLDDTEKATCRQLFAVLAEKQNYPLYLHCWGGADRTGTLAFLLGAVLGVAYEDLLLDYELTSLSIWGRRSRDSDLFNAFLHALDRYGTDQDSVSIKAENYLLSCGVSREDLTNIRELMIQP